MELKSVSVIVCCYNSSSRIKSTLEYLSKQVLTDLSCELILVDNNSTDNTSELALSLWNEFGNPYPIQIIKEPNPGLSKAREAGIANSNGELIVFCDDDNWLQSDYIQRAVFLMNTNPQIGILGGRTYPVYETNPPSWFVERVKNFGIGTQAIESSDITISRGWVWGAGSCYRKNVFTDMRKSDYTQFLSDRKGKKMSTGGDVELCFIAVRLGYKIWYDSDLVCAHYMPSSRFNIKKFHELCVANGKNDPLFSLYTSSLSIPNRTYLIVMMLKLIKKLSKSFYKVDKNYVTNSTIIYFTRIGELKGIFFILLNFKSIKKIIICGETIAQFRKNIPKKQINI